MKKIVMTKHSKPFRKSGLHQMKHLLMWNGFLNTEQQRQHHDHTDIVQDHTPRRSLVIYLIGLIAIMITTTISWLMGGHLYACIRDIVDEAASA